MCTVDIVFFWSQILRIVHQVWLWSVSQIILGNFTRATVRTFNCSKHLGLKFERAIPGRVRVFFCNFVRWQPSIKWFSQIWLHTRYESRKKKPESFYNLGYLLELIIKIWWTWIFFFWNLSNLGYFPMENPLYRLRSHFSGRNLAKLFQTGFHFLMPFNLITLPQELRMWCWHSIFGNINIFASTGLQLVIIYM